MPEKRPLPKSRVFENRLARKAARGSGARVSVGFSRALTLCTWVTWWCTYGNLRSADLGKRRSTGNTRKNPEGVVLFSFFFFSPDTRAMAAAAGYSPTAKKNGHMSARWLQAISASVIFHAQPVILKKVKPCCGGAIATAAAPCPSGVFFLPNGRRRLDVVRVRVRRPAANRWEGEKGRDLVKKKNYTNETMGKKKRKRKNPRETKTSGGGGGG